MKARFQAHLIHPPFGDPGLYVRFRHERRALLFDLGDLHPLSARALLKVSHIFISHTHMDHFVGLDTLVRVGLGRDRILHLFGPPGLIQQVQARLWGYTWNLVAHYREHLVLRVTEVHPDRLVTGVLPAREGFALQERHMAPWYGNVLYEEASFRIRARILDHGIPCLGFCLEERARVHVLKNRLEARGFPVGPWLQALKQAVWEGWDEERPFRVWWREGGRIRESWYPFGELRRDLLQITPGQRLGYVVDVAFHEANVSQLVSLLQGVDLLYLEACFLERDGERALKTRHLTARQAGWLARRVGAGRLIPFHFSPKYAPDPDPLIQEALEAFEGKTIPVPPGVLP